MSASDLVRRLHEHRMWVNHLLHICTHAQYTTAQLVNMLRQLGQAELPNVMLITLARQEAAGEMVGR